MCGSSPASLQGKAPPAALHHPEKLGDLSCSCSQVPSTKEAAHGPTSPEALSPGRPWPAQGSGQAGLAQAGFQPRASPGWCGTDSSSCRPSVERDSSGHPGPTLEISPLPCSLALALSLQSQLPLPLLAPRVSCSHHPPPSRLSFGS